MSTIQKSFEQAEKFFREGKLSQSLQLYERVIQQCKRSNNVNNLKYNSYINMSTIYLQQNSFPLAKQCLLKASHMNPYRYQAHYNMSILQLSHNTNQSYLRSKPHLSKCLSLLCSEMGHLTSSLKTINRSISLWTRNYKAYIYRARLYEKMGKVKLAENQYERLGFELDEYGYGGEVVMEIYKEKAGFWRRVGQGERVGEALGGFFRAKIGWETGKGIGQQGNVVQEDKSEAEAIIGSEEDQGEQQVRNIVKGMLREIQQLITKISSLKKTIQQGNQSVQIQQLTSSDNLSPKQIQQPNPTSFQPPLPTEQPTKTQLPPTNPTQTSAQTLFHQNPATQTSNPSISINQDQDSAILNQKIQQLQKQIKQSGGNIPEIRDMSRNSQEENFLEFEIEKTIEEINRKKIQEEYKQVSKVTGNDGKESVLLVESKLHDPEEFLQQKSPRSSLLNQNAENDTLTIKSHTSENCQLSLQQMQEYKAFRLQVRSASMFELKSAKKQSFVKIFYNTHEDVSPKAKTQNLSWNHIFPQMPIGHDLQNEFQGDESGYQIKVEVHAKEGGWLSWHHDVLLGKGTIRLMEKGGTKCTLQDQKGKKVGVLYYKVKLIRFQE